MSYALGKTQYCIHSHEFIYTRIQMAIRRTPFASNNLAAGLAR